MIPVLFWAGVSTRETLSVHTVCVVPRRPRGDAKKCRKVYGMNHREQWCTQCKWKKACTRFGENNWDKQQNQNYFNDDSIQTESVMKRLCMQNLREWSDLNWASGDSNLSCFQISHTYLLRCLDKLKVSHQMKTAFGALILPWRKERVKKVALILMKHSQLDWTLIWWLGTVPLHSIPKSKITICPFGSASSTAKLNLAFIPK